MDQTETIVPIAFQKIKEGRIDTLRAWADSYLRAMPADIGVVAAQVEADNGRTFLRMKVPERTAELETSFQIGEDPVRRAASFARWHREQGIGAALALVDEEREPLIARMSAAAWATASDGSGLTEAVRRSMLSRALYGSGLGRRHEEYKPFGSMAIATPTSWTDSAPYRASTRAKVRMSFISVNADRRADWRLADGELVIYRANLPDTIVNGLRGLAIGRLIDDPMLTASGAIIKTATSVENGALRVGFEYDVVPVSEAAAWIDSVRSQGRMAA